MCSNMEFVGADQRSYFYQIDDLCCSVLLLPLCGKEKWRKCLFQYKYCYVRASVEYNHPIFFCSACYEGLSSAAVVINYPKSVALSGLRRNYFSLSSKRGSSMLNEAKLRTGSLNNKTNGMESAPENLSRVAPDPTDIMEKFREALGQYSKVSKKLYLFLYVQNVYTCSFTCKKKVIIFLSIVFL